ncbi:MAG: Tn3 family transposase [Pseudonocardiaceae bacterium]
MARLLDGVAWQAVKADVLTSLGLPEAPEELLGCHVVTLDEALRYVGDRLAANADVRVDEAGKIHVSGDKAIAEPPSLIDLRKRVAAMLPRVDIGEAILEVMGWVPEFLESLIAPSGGASRMAGLDVTIAACLTSQALNIGYGPVAAEGVAALERRRLGHVGRTYLRAANYTAANPHLITKQAGIGFAQALGGGLVAAIDGMRFVVPVPSLFAKPNRKFFGPKRGMTFLNMINDQAFGTAHKIVAGTDRDCLHAIDLFFNSGAADLPEVLITDTGSYVVTWTPCPPLKIRSGRPGRRQGLIRGDTCRSASGVGMRALSWLSCSATTASRSRSSQASCGPSGPGTTRPTPSSPTPMTCDTCGVSSPVRA